mgnify:CR=1 FL=1
MNTVVMTEKMNFCLLTTRHAAGSRGGGGAEGGAAGGRGGGGGQGRGGGGPGPGTGTGPGPVRGGPVGGGATGGPTTAAGNNGRGRDENYCHTWNLIVTGDVGCAPRSERLDVSVSAVFVQNKSRTITYLPATH